MKKWLIPVIILVVIVVIAFGILYPWAVGFNNTAVEYEANAKTAWSNVESSYQRRNDLIGNLVKTVQGAADFERGTLTDVIEARAKATSTTIDANDLSPEKLAAFQEARKQELPAKIISYLRQECPQQSQALQTAQLKDLVNTQVEQAQRFKLNAEWDLCRYCWLGLSFS